MWTCPRCSLESKTRTECERCGFAEEIPWPMDGIRLRKFLKFELIMLAAKSRIYGLVSTPNSLATEDAIRIYFTDAVVQQSVEESLLTILRVIR